MSTTRLMTFAAGIISFICFSVAYIVYYSLLHPLARFLGPIVASLSNGWKLWAVATDRMPFETIKLHAKYGPVVRFGPNDLLFNSPDALEAIYRKGWPKGDFYNGFDSTQVPGLFNERDPTIHAAKRRIFALGFSRDYIRKMEKHMNARYAIMRTQLDAFASDGKVFDLRHYITYCIVDILGELSFGQAMGNQIDRDPEKIPPVTEALFGCAVTGQVPWAASIMRKIAALTPAAKRFLIGHQQLMNVVMENIEKRAANPVQRDDMLNKFMSVREEKTGKPMSWPMLVVTSLELIVGGTFTTGSTLHLLFGNLSRHPNYLQRCVAELDERLPPLGPSQPCYDIDGLEERLDFVNAAIRENHRQNAVDHMAKPRTVPEGGAEVAGFHVPGGTQCSVNTHSFHHNPAIWGSDHDVFDPTRWYDDRAEGLSSLVIPYSVGKRNCVGQNLANANILKMSTTLLKAYEFDFVNVEEPLVFGSHTDGELKTPLMVRCKRRGALFQHV